MLQQTTVAAVVPYFQRFIAAFPTVADLAAADEQDVLRLWQGLGYYRRARHLHQAAKILVEKHAGQLPDDPEVWRSLPGVGRYILGAVLSQAFDRRLPIVEANSQRVLCRLFAKNGDVSREPLKSWLWEKAAELVPARRAGDFNQAMMELGALVCTPKEPNCGRCPLHGECVARQRGQQHAIPRKAVRRLRIDQECIAVAVRKRGRFLLVQRSPDALRWAGFWEFPQTERRQDESAGAAASRLLKSVGISARIGEEFLTLQHGVTHHRITLVGLDAEWQAGVFRAGVYRQCRWLFPQRFAEFPAGTAQRKVLAATCRSNPPTNTTN